jgi:putative chitinase
LIQITGRANYEAFGKARGRDFTTEPNNEMIANIPDLAVDSACWFWTELKHRQHGSFVNLNELADHDDLHGITRVVNGGSNGILERYQHLSRAKCLLIPSMRLPAFMTARVDSWSFTKFSWK